MKDEQMRPLLDVWFTDRDEAARDANGDIAKLMADVLRTRQQGRWWPLRAFDRPMSTVPTREVAPAPIPATNGHTRPRGFTMFSALKFMVASVIVALFGGFLLSGVLTTQQGGELLPGAVTGSPSPTTTEALLSAVEVTAEEVESGVYRVDSDGVRDLASVKASDVVAGYDGGIWLLRDDGFLRLGSEESHVWPAESATYDGRIFEVAPDGTIWIIEPLYPLIPGTRSGTALRSADGEVWVAQPCPGANCVGITVAPDGEVWASSGRTVGSWPAGQLDPTGWEPLDGPIPPLGSSAGFESLFFTDAGELYATACPYICSLYRHQDGAWSELSYFGPDKIVDVGRDGTVWQSGRGTLFGEVSDGTDTEEQWLVAGSDAVGSELSGGLARFAGGAWTGWTLADLPDVVLPIRSDPDPDEFGVGIDGSLWISPWCDGLVRFDGVATDHFLSGQCVSMDIAADGSVWALAEDRDGKGLYVITPEAVADTG